MDAALLSKMYGDRSVATAAVLVSWQLNIAGHTERGWQE
jgi:hypothetical protein